MIMKSLISKNIMKIYNKNVFKHLSKSTNCIIFIIILDFSFEVFLSLIIYFTNLIMIQKHDLFITIKFLIYCNVMSENGYVFGHFSKSTNYNKNNLSNHLIYIQVMSIIFR